MTLSLDLSAQLHQAVAAQLAGNLDAAEALYQSILAQDPQYASAMHGFGLLRHQRGDSNGAIEWLARACQTRPTADWFNDLGNMLALAGHAEMAGRAFRQALALQPTPLFWNNLGSVLLAQNLNEDAAQAFIKALQLDGDYIDALENLGNTLERLGQSEEGSLFLCRAYVLRPAEVQPPKMRGIAFYRLGRIDEAAAVYRAWLQQEPDNPTARHLLAGCSGQNVPHRASDAYVATMFDQFAAEFDERLRSLDYQAPQQIAAALAPCLIADASLQVLDAGCGTGLCLPVLRPYAQRLVGVDLSSGMLAKAAARGGYDELVQAELNAWLYSQPGVFDLICAADLVIYFGELAPLFAAFRQAMRPTGLLAFSAEATTDVEYRLLPSGRYSHSEAGLRANLAAAGLGVVSLIPAVIRVEFGEPVHGWTILARLPAA
ncbi:tetratricopeptide repeat protein [Amantichitinum ursilacus]|uniref:Biotin biosynthesis protein BioC n=1 Tax=Amantichitinum ursilacus TaxID=857265 RepID=A0A0N1JRZ2_9NEIS|nr:tetratricopeptide repeat protein [Amantichitinum ursilacus]KPC50542.1 biotin biosynthesis protein BioC [Amantichitinum ursilacus]